MTPRLQRATEATLAAIRLQDEAVITLCYSAVIALAATDRPAELGLGSGVFTTLNRAIIEQLGQHRVEPIKQAAWAYMENPNVQ